MTRTFVLLIALGAVTAHAQPGTFRYTVREGDTCASIAQRFYGNARRYDLIHAHNPDLGPPPHRLRAGRDLSLPTPEMANAEASLAAARGHVDHRPPAVDRWRRARAGLPLLRGHQVTTHDAAAAELRFRDGSALQMRERTLVIVVGEGRHVSRRVGRAQLERGTLRARLSELAGGLHVQTPSAETTVGGDATVGVDAEGTSRVANRSGRAMVVRSPRGRVRLPAGTGTLVRPGARPNRPRRLPPAPRWSNDLAGRFVGFGGSGARLEGGWEPVEGAARYRVEVARRADGTDQVASVEVEGQTHRFEARGIGPGAYYLSVSTIDADGLEGRPSPRRAMIVREARILPPGGGAHVPTQAVARVVPGTAIVAPLGYRCALGSETPQAIVTARHPGRRRLRCLDRRQRPVPGPDVLVVRARPTLRSAPVVPRGGRARVAFVLDAPVALPDRLIARAPRGIAVGPVQRRRDGTFVTEVGASTDAPEHVAIELEVAAGAERIGVATLSLSVRGGRTQTARASRAGR